jgi:nucleoside phosphorylase
MEPLANLKRLATILEMRKKNSARPYHLLLTSALSLTLELLQQICGSQDWAIFRRYMHELGSNDRLHALAPLLQGSQHRIGYRALARLIRARYFATILTTSIDSSLEDALIEEGLSPQSFQVLIPDRDTDEYIVQALNEHTGRVRIIKLHGSLREGAIGATFPDFFELRPALLESVQRLLNQDSLIVGSIEREDDISRALTRSGRGSVYYVLPHAPASGDSVVKLIEARGNAPETYLIAGQYGDFDRFFTALETHLLQGASLSSVQADISAADESVQDQTSTQQSSSQEQKPDGEETPRADVLLVTVTEVETGAVFDVLKELCERAYKRCFVGDKTYYDLGMINGARVFLVQSEMGTGGPGGSLLTVHEGVLALNPSVVVMVGIAFGLNERKQHIGDILVASQLCGYELQRYGTHPDGTPFLVLRGDRATASIRLLDRFRSGYQDWQGQSVQFGLILSGEKLVDNLDFRDQLHRLEGEAIGGEMEGAGLYAVAQRLKVDWILVKAICDWADGKKSRNKAQRQKKAARNAALFTLHVLQKTNFKPAS